MSNAIPTRQTEPASDGRISARAATRLAWSLWVVCVALIALALLLDFVTGDDFPFAPGERPDPVFAVLTGVLSLAYPTVGTLIASRLPGGLALLRHGTGPQHAALHYGVRRLRPAREFCVALGRVRGLVLHVVRVGEPYLGGVPDAVVPPRPAAVPSWRIVAWAAVCGALLSALGRALEPAPLPDLVTHRYAENPFGIAAVVGGEITTYDLFPALTILGMALLLTSCLSALLSVVLRLRRARGDARQQLKWFLFAAVPLTLFQSLILLNMLVAILTEKFAYVETVYVLQSWEVFRVVLYVLVLAVLFVPVVTYIAILRYRLYDIDVVINRTLVYGSLSACIVGIYVIAVGALGALFQARGNLGVSLLATGMIALLFQPLRIRLQRSVNRLMYGERDDPYAVISRLGRRLEATLAPRAVLPTVVETIAQALKLPYAAILLKEGEGFRTAAAYGSPTGDPETLPLVYQREEIGRLVISPRSPGEGFSDADLHDGVGPTLTGLALQLNAARKLVVRNRPQDAEETLARLEERTQETLTEMRRLIDTPTAAPSRARCVLAS